MAAALDAAGLSKGTGHTSLASQPSGKPAWDRRTRHPSLSRHQSAFAADEGAHGRSTLHPQASVVAPERSHASFAPQRSSLSSSLPCDHQHGHAKSRLAESHASLHPSSTAGYEASSFKLRKQASQGHALRDDPDHQASPGTNLRHHKSQAASGQKHLFGAPEHRQMRAGQLIGSPRRPSVVQQLQLTAASPLGSKAGGSVRSSGSFLSAQAPGNAGAPMQGSAGTSPTMLDLLQSSSANGIVSIRPQALVLHACSCV